ncbi:MAG: response regulator [Anaerolineales bacterium]|nr:response regulator [Anaerolineales bacterium]
MTVASTILIVDDSLSARKMVQGMLARESYQLAFAVDGHDGIAKAEQLRPDVILLDVLLPDLDGFTVCQRLRAHADLAEVPVLLMTGLTEREHRLRGLEAGADDFLTKPIDPEELRARLRTITRLNRYRTMQSERARFSRLAELSPDGIAVLDGAAVVQHANDALARMVGLPSGSDLIGRPFALLLRPNDAPRVSAHIAQLLKRPTGNGRLEVMIARSDGLATPAELVTGQLAVDGQQLVQIIARDITERRLAETQIRMLHQELLDAYDATLEGWARALELRDQETKGHSQRVTDMTVRLARSIQVSGEALDHIRRGALLHDIGKMGVPDAILLKPGRLTPEERQIMELHPGYAYEMLMPIDFLRPSLDIPYCHHEKWDGSGYPRGLKGDEIPLSARLFAIVDVWDALSSDRPYRAAMPAAEVEALIRQAIGTHFDPRAADVFFSVVGECQPVPAFQP